MIAFFCIVLLGTFVLGMIEWVLFEAWLAFLESWRKGGKK